MLNILWRNLRWRLQNPVSIIVTILQPLLWLVLYSAVANQTMNLVGINNYTAFVLPGIIVLVTFSSCSSSGIINYLNKKSGSFYRILISPVSRKCIILGQTLEAMLLSFFEIGILFVVSLFFSVRLHCGIDVALVSFVLIVLTSFFVSNLAYSVSLILPNEVIYETVMNAIVLPVFFVSTALVPEEGLHGKLQILVKINPFTHVINSLRSAILYGKVRSNEAIMSILLMMILCIIVFIISNFRLKMETRS